MKKENMKNKKKNSKVSYYFFGLVILIYAAAALVDPATVKSALRIFFGILLQITPVLVLVFILLLLIDLFVKPDKVIKYLGRESGVTGWLVAIVGGIISSGPIYVWFPFLAEMEAKGMRTGLAATFLYNRAVKVPLLPLMIFYFGVVFTVVLTIYMIFFSVVSGYCTEWLVESGGAGEVD